MVPLNGLSLEQEGNNYRKDSKGNHFLDNFELHEVERTAVTLESNPVGRNGEAVFEERNSPGKQDNQDQRPARGDFHFLQFEMAVPRERHEDIRENEHEDGPEPLHSFFFFRAANLRDFFEFRTDSAAFFLSLSKYLNPCSD